MVRRRILEDPSVTNDLLFAAATEMEPDLQSLTMRQFNARYPLRVRRWELSERTRMLHPSGPLSRAAAANPAAPVPPRPHLSLAVADNTDGSTDSQPHEGASQSQTTVAAEPPQAEPPSLQAGMTAPRPTEESLAAATPPALTVSQTVTSRLEAQPLAQDEPAEPEPETTAPAPMRATATRPSRSRRATRRPADDARAEVMTVMLRWTTAIGQASGIPEVFATLATVDDYVDHIAEVLDIP